MSRVASWRSRVAGWIAPRAEYQPAGSGRIASTPKEIADLMVRLLGGTGAVPVTEQTAMRNGVVYACTRILSDSVGLLPLLPYRRDGDVAAPDLKHPLFLLLTRKPNRWQTAFTYKRLQMGHILLAGNHYSFIRRGLNDVVKELIPFANPRSMKVEQDPVTLEIRYKYSLPGGAGERGFKQSEILHLRGLSTDGVLGLSVIEAAAQAIGLAIQQERHGSNVLKQGASPGGVLKHPALLSPEAATRLRESFDAIYSGQDNAGKTILLEEGLSWEKVAMTSEEAQFIDGRKLSRTEIGMFFGVPPHMYGDTERGTSWGSGIEQQGVGFVTYTLLPHLTNITQAVDAALLSEKEQDTHHTSFDTEPLTRADFKTRQEGRKIQKDAGVISPNEWRRFEGLPPREGGDEFKEAAAVPPGLKQASEQDDEGEDEGAKPEDRRQERRRQERRRAA